jgi:uncharacterized protein (TIGR02246 family)
VRTALTGMTKRVFEPHDPVSAAQSVQLAIKHATSGQPGRIAVLFHSAALTGTVGPDSAQRPVLLAGAGDLRGMRPLSADRVPGPVQPTRRRVPAGGTLTVYRSERGRRLCLPVVSQPVVRVAGWPGHDRSMTSTETEILRSVIDQWKSAVDAHDPHRVASHFTDDAIFQGLHPYSVGPDSVAEYYDSQPVGMTAAYDIRETRRLADDLVLGYLSVDFAFTDRPVLTVYLSVIVRRIGDAWFISHYQVSRLG